MMDRAETTKFLSDLLICEKLTGIGKYWAREVTLDYGLGKGKQKRVDFMQFVPENQYSIGGIEKGIFICYEIKSCKADVFSGHGMNFIGEKNYIVMTMQTYKDIMHELDKIPYHVGILVTCAETNEKWTLKTQKCAHTYSRERSMSELLFCMLRSGR